METSLKEWLQLAYTDILAVCDDNILSDEEYLQGLVKFIFRLEETPTIEEVHQLLDVSTSNVQEYDIVDLIIKLLRYSISPDCSSREMFVSHILSMESTIQNNLMMAIQEVQHETLPDESENLVNEDYVNKSNLSIYSPECENCIRKDMEIMNYVKEVKCLLDREKSLEETLKSENIVQLNRLIDAEVIIGERDALIKEQQQSIDQLQKSEVILNDALKELEPYKAKYLSLLDEVDILTPYVKRAETAEIQVSRLMERLDKFDGIKEQLKIETSSHNETHQKLLQYESELETLRKAKMHLDDYRERYNESNIVINELRINLEKEVNKVSQLTDINQHLQIELSKNSNYNDVLKNSLYEINSQMRNIESSDSTIGNNINELNPEVKKELEKLRVENKELLLKIDMSSVESLEKMQQQIIDQNFMNSSLQTKWMTVKEELAAANIVISNLNQTILNQNNKHKILQCEYNELYHMAQSEIETICVNNTIRYNNMVAKYDNEISELTLTKDNMINELQSFLHNQTTNLNHANQCIAFITKEKDELTELLRSTHHQLEEVTQSTNRMVEAHETYKREVELSYHNETMEMRKAFSDEKNMLKTEYEDKINCEVIKYQNLNADLEEERLKRRKVEREKRFFETEANRYKSQYQVSASTSGGSEHDVNAALKEITSMQHQLDAYKEEIKRLRQNGAASTISSGAGNLESQTKITEIQGEYIDEPTTHAKSSSSRYPVRVRVRDPAAAGAQMAPTSDISVYIEQTDLLERKIESLSKEKRELIAKNLEETKDKMELSQKLLQSERESALLKSKTTKLTLENERLERIIASNEYSKGTNIAAKSYRINIAAKSITGIENINTQTGVPTEQL